MRSPKRQIVLVEPKKLEGHDNVFFPRLAPVMSPTFKFVPRRHCAQLRFYLWRSLQAWLLKRRICRPVLGSLVILKYFLQKIWSLYGVAFAPGSPGCPPCELTTSRPSALTTHTRCTLVTKTEWQRSSIWSLPVSWIVCHGIEISSATEISRRRSPNDLNSLILPASGHVTRTLRAVLTDTPFGSSRTAHGMTAPCIDRETGNGFMKLSWNFDDEFLQLWICLSLYFTSYFIIF